MSWRRTYVGVVFLVGISTVADAGYWLWHEPADPRWLVLAVLTWLAGPLALRVPGAHLSLTISESLSFMVAFGYGWEPAVVTVAIDGLFASTRQRTRRLDRTLFNIAEPAVSMAACVLVLDWASGLSAAERATASITELIVPGFVAAAVYLVLNSGLTAAAVATETQAKVVTVWRNHISWLALDCFGGTSLALLVITSTREPSLAGLMAAAPLMLALYGAYRASFRRTEDTVQHLRRLNQLHLATVEGLAMAIDAKDQVTHGHVKRVRERAITLAHALGVRDEALLRALEAGAVLHDVGKLGVPDHILNKPGPLTPAEYEHVKRHTVVGAEILSAVDFPYPVVPIVRHHHESWDGTGYPDRIGGEAIPLGARILAVIDCHDALTSDRPYRRAMTQDEALAVLRERRGTMYDPQVVDAFDAMIRPPAETVSAEPPSDTVPSPEVAPTGPVESLDGAFDPAGLVRLVDILASHLAPDAVMSVVAPQLLRGMRATAVALLVPGTTDESLRLACLLGTHAAEFGGLRPLLGRGISGWVAAHRHTIANADPALEFWDSAAPADLPNQTLSVPVVPGELLAGALTVYAFGAAFSADDQALLEDVARALAPSFHRVADVPDRPLQDLSTPATEPADDAVLDALLGGEQAGSPVFPALTVLSVESVGPVQADLPVPWVETMRRTARAGDIVLAVSPTRALVLAPGDTQEVTDRLVSWFGRDVSGPSPGATLRAGIAATSGDGSGLGELIRAADARMRDAVSGVSGITSVRGEERLAS